MRQPPTPEVAPRRNDALWLLPTSQGEWGRLASHLNSSFPLKEFVPGCGASLYHLYSFQTAMILSFSNVPRDFNESIKLPKCLSNWVWKETSWERTKYSKWSTIQSISWAECLSRLSLTSKLSFRRIWEGFPADWGWGDEEDWVWKNRENLFISYPLICWNLSADRACRNSQFGNECWIRLLLLVKKL